MTRFMLRPDAEPVDPESLGDINELIRARVDGRISRRALMRRAAALGLAAPVILAALHITSDYAYGAPSNGRAAALRARRQESQAVKVAGPTQPAGTMTEGGTLVYATNEQPETLHPWVSALVTTFHLTAGIVESLLKFDSNQQLIPSLATELPEISADALTYTFPLRQGVTFHNGDPFGPQDVIDSWKAIMNPDYGAINQESGWSQIADIQPGADGASVVITLSEVLAPFASFMGSHDNPICPAAEIAKGGEAMKSEYGRAPIGTGAMTFVEWKAAESITLARNDAYWGGRPHLDGVVYRIVPDDNTMMVQLQTGEAQLAGVAASRLDEALGYENVQVLEYPTMAWSHFDLKHVDFLRMTKVRQALDFATPKQQIIDQLLKGRALPSIGDQAPGTWAHNPNLQPRPFDQEQAKALLCEAGLTETDGGWEGPTPAVDTTDPNGPATGPVKPFEMEIWTIGGESQQQQIGEVVAAAWNQIGIKTEAKSEDVSTIFGPEGYVFTDKMNAGLYSWFNGNDPADSFYYWHSDSIPSSPTGSGGNAIAFFFPLNFQDEIDALTEAGSQETDQETRKQIYWQVQELLLEEVPVIFISWATAYDALASNVGGYWPSAFNRSLWNVHEWYLAE